MGARSPLFRLAALGPAAFLMLSAPAVADAQSMWLPRESAEPSIAVEGLKPFFTEGSVSFPSSAWLVSGRLRVSNSTVLVGEIPFAFASFEETFFLFENGAAVGNIYFGGEFGSRDSPFFLELGARAPLAPEFNTAALLGTFADLDRWEAYAPNTLPISALGNYFNVSSDGLVLRFRAGAVVWIPTESGPDTELLALLNAQGGYQTPGGTAGFLAGLTSRILVTGEGGFGGRSFFQAGASGWIAVGQVRPGLLLLVPLDGDLQEIIDLTVGLNAQIVFR